MAVGKAAGHEQIVSAREPRLHFLRDRPFILCNHDRCEKGSERRAFADEASDLRIDHHYLRASLGKLPALAYFSESLVCLLQFRQALLEFSTKDFCLLIESRILNGYGRGNGK